MGTQIQKRTVIGTVTSVELRKYPAYAPSRYIQGEQYDMKLLVCVEEEDGDRYWFFSPSASFTISGNGGFYVAVLRENDFVGKQDWRCEGHGGARGLGDTPIAKLKIGDQIKLVGRVKREQTRYGVQLSHVKKLAA